MVLRYSTGEEIPYRVYSISNHWDGCRHIEFTIINFSVEHCRALANIVPQLRRELSQVHIMAPYGRDPNGGEMENSTELPWSNRVFIYTNHIAASKSDILAIFRGVGLKAVLTDDERWKHVLSSKRPDVSSSNDFPGKENLALPLTHAMARPDRRGHPLASSTSILDELQLRLHGLEIDEIYALIDPLLIGASISTPILSTGTVLFRGRRFTTTFNKSRAITVRDLSYPPASVTKLGRVNRPNRPFFYCSASQEVIYY
jgi:hypothetical protein